MSSSHRNPPADQSEREAAIRERARNVVVDAGAGTGKTTILVERVIELVAPGCEASTPLPIGRVGAITFTRKAAGELKLRIRQAVLRELGEPSTSARRKSLLLEALDGLDTAHFGTIHSFADRLLRLRPVEALLSPEYLIETDIEALERETYELLVRLSEAGTLPARFFADAAMKQCAEAAQQTILDVLRAGIPAAGRDVGYQRYRGLDDLVQGMIRSRDRDVTLPTHVAPDLDSFSQLARGYADAVATLTGDSPGARALHRFGRATRIASRERDPSVAYHKVFPLWSRLLPSSATLRGTFLRDKAAWELYKAEHREAKTNPSGSHYVAPMLASLQPWLATGLARLRPVVLALYDAVKQAHRVVDQQDLLIRLRDLLRDRPEIRVELQGLFDHILVDEFQDTDPLQAEILVYLCEQGKSTAGTWTDTKLEAGRITIVGDPKQSIYRFRRADVAIYDRVRGHIADQGALVVSLSTNFRSHPSLIRWYNSQLSKLLGEPNDGGGSFNPETGQVYHQALAPGRDDAEAARVHVLRIESETAGGRAEELRPIEAEGLAHYLDWLVNHSEVLIPGSRGTASRRVAWGDIAVLAISTASLRYLFPKLDALRIPYSLRGGKLFASDPLQRQLILALRALADPDDGVAKAALMRPPFFGLDFDDLVAHRAKGAAVAKASAAERDERVRAALGLVAELRRQRHRRSPGDTARALIEQTALARTVALEPNGSQRLAWLRDVCAWLDQRALSEGLDFDTTTAELRAWIDHPPQLDPPVPVGADAVHITTIHQAKGLQWPVVVWWDGRARMNGTERGLAWGVGTNGEWAIDLRYLSYEAPRGLGLAAQEKAYDDQERRRLVYVAATRAAELLVVPSTGPTTKQKSLICEQLLDGHPTGTVEELAAYGHETEPEWVTPGDPQGPTKAQPATDLLKARQASWRNALAVARMPRLVPQSVTAAATGVEAPAAAEETAAEASVDAAEQTPVARLQAEADHRTEEPKPGTGRFGPLFGHTVHRALQLSVRRIQERGEMSVADLAKEAVAQAAAECGLRTHLTEAADDVVRGVAALDQEGLLAAGRTIRLEYPVAGTDGETTLLRGRIDFVSAEERQMDVVDFKTDVMPADGGPGEGAVSRLRRYAAQVCEYGRLLEAAAGPQGRTVRVGLLFTSEGSVRWL